MKLSLGYSPCPNDTFIFDAMVHGKIDTEGLEFEVILADVEELNRKAFSGELDVTKLSYHAYTHLTDKYILLRSGSALGNNCGPLLVSYRAFNQEEINSLKIAIPGRYTTANFLLSFAFPEAKNRVEMLFSDIEAAVLNGNVDLGVIIHENRFTYHERGMIKVMDLGEYWEQTTGLPIPLGGIVGRRHFNKDLAQKINRVLRRSVEYAFAHPNASRDYVCAHAQEMEFDVMQKHIQLYVNQYSIDLGEKGEAAVRKLFDTLKDSLPMPFTEPIILENED
jgi:1,4-dihydroxy-6-naphthoate synthase